ncbi:MAG: endonuclease/exonuclease/phosphatase family protein [Deltaproteobacteria bacterium]|nr:endonuclease/exonuclease/phosphatase family protein [Deltaproteobacteria bacterium]
MKFKTGSFRTKFFFACTAFAVIIVIFLFSGTFVNNYYQILTPGKGHVIESNQNFSQKTVDSESIKILNWNVYKQKRPGFSDDFIKLSKNKDIILIQEACFKKNLWQAFRVSGMGWYFAQSFSYCKKSLYATGVMTLSKASPIFSGYIRTKFKEPLTHTPKISLVTKYSLTGTKKKLLVVNTHGINFVKSKAFESQMADLGKKIKKHRGPAIFAGDFNTWNKKRIAILTRIVTRSGLKEARFHPDTRTKRFRYPLDHIFYKGLKIKKTKIFNKIRSSDHKAVGVEFCFTGPGRGKKF